MKGKKLWAVILTICLIVSSIGVISVMASDEKDIEISVTTDKTVLKANDVVTVSVNLDKFMSTISGDTRKLITSIQFNVPFDADIFEYVENSMQNGYIYAVDETDHSFSDANVDGNVVRVAAVYRNANSGAIAETETSSPFLTFQLKVKDSVSQTVSADFSIDGVILKNLNLDQEYTYNMTPAAVKVYTNPVITVDGSADIASSYTEAVQVAATDSSTITVNGEVKTNPCTISAEGSYTVVAENAAGLTDEKTFSIVPVVDSIEVKTLPGKTEYVKGAALDLTGGVITAYMSNGETKEIQMTDPEVTASGFDGASVGTQTVTVAYKGKTAAFDVNVKDREVTSVAWLAMPETEIIEEQDLSTALANAKITAAYDDGETEEVAVTEVMCTGFDKTKIGTQTVTVTYGGKELTFDITVNEKQLTGIAVKTAPVKTEYVEGTGLDVSGGVITASYDNGKTEDIDLTEDMISGYDNTSVGTQTITVTYGGKTASFQVTVKEKSLESIAITTAPSKTTVLEGKELDVTDGVITASYDNGTTKTVNMTNSMISGFDASKAGNQTVTVSYEENGITKTTTLEVTVQAKSIAKVELVSGPDKATVLEGKELDLTGAKINVIYDNDTVDENIEVTSDMISGFDKSVVGTQSVTVTYNGVKADADFEVIVQPKSVTGIKITNTPKTEYIEGNAFTSEGGKITVSYDNDETKVVDFSDPSVTVTPADTAVPGSNKEVTVTYTEGGMEYTAVYTINVAEKTLVSIAVTKTPAHLSVIEGQELDVTDGEITLSYDNDTETVVAMDNSMISGFDKNLVGTQVVTVSYNGKTTTMEVIVAAKSVTGIELVSRPDAATVTEGLDFDLTGGKILVLYDNGTSEEMDMEAAMLTLDNSAVGMQTAVITYGGKTVTFDVEVLAKAAENISTNFNGKEVAEGTDILAAGLEVYLEYNNNTKDTLDLAEVEITGYDSAKLGEQRVTATYVLKTGEEEKLFTTEFIVYVLAKSEIDFSAEGTSDEEYVVISKETAEEIINQVTAALNGMSDKFVNHEIFDVTVLSKLTGLTVSPDGTMKITMNIPEGFDKTKTLAVYRLDGDQLIELKSQISGDQIIFETDHSGKHVIVEKAVEEQTTTTEANTTNQSSETTTSDTTSVKTGDKTNVLVILAVIALAGAGFVAASRKKEQM